MSIKRHIRRIIFISFWCLAGAGILVLLIAAVRSRKQKDCAGFEIEINGPKGQLFIDHKDVEGLLTNNGKEKIKGKELQQFDLRKMESLLKSNVWISDAELFFDNEQVLQIRVKEREPVARIFTLKGDSYFIDSNAIRLPLSDKQAARIPVFTGFPSEAIKLDSLNNLLMHQIAEMSGMILRDSFLMAMIAQVDIKDNSELELIPEIGQHIIEWGAPVDNDKKFRRLKIFYNTVISQTGLDYYDRIRVQYAGQVVGVKKSTPLSKADSLQAVRNVLSLIQQAQTEQERQLMMDSMTVYKPSAHLHSNDQGAALTFDSTAEKPTIPSAVPEGKQTENKESPTLKSQTPYEKSQKPKVKK